MACRSILFAYVEEPLATGLAQGATIASLLFSKFPGVNWCLTSKTVGGNFCAVSET